jgi:hypothetical protein
MIRNEIISALCTKKSILKGMNQKGGSSPEEASSTCFQELDQNSWIGIPRP